MVCAPCVFEETAVQYSQSKQNTEVPQAEGNSASCMEAFVYDGAGIG